MNFPNYPDELSEFSGLAFLTFLIFHPKISVDLFFLFFFRSHPPAFPNFRRTFPILWLLSEFSSTFRILVYFPNFGRKWTRNRVPRFPLFSNSALNLPFGCLDSLKLTFSSLTHPPTIILRGGEVEAHRVAAEGVLSLSLSLPLCLCLWKENSPSYCRGCAVGWTGNSSLKLA